jgi:hypothetical protein
MRTRIGVYCSTTKSPFENTYRCEYKTRTDLNQTRLWWTIRLCGIFFNNLYRILDRNERMKQLEAYLIIPEPYFVVYEREGENMIDEGFGLSCLGRNTKYL